ncbi:MAG TPA: hypothetical protein VEP49_11415 [Acidimicrobiia bacterium]|nr:hypothetical protein [Acidimicrobiia bacterium]
MAGDTPEHVLLVSRGMATAVAPDDGITHVQAELLHAITLALTGEDVNYLELEPLGSDELADVLRERDQTYRQRIVHHMVLGELVLRPLPLEVSRRVEVYATAIGVEDRFVRVARRYAMGAYGLAWKDLQRSGFTEHWEQADRSALRATVDVSGPFEGGGADPELEAKWEAFRELPEGSLGRSVWQMYDGRGFALPGSAHGPSPYLAQHDFVHVIADYGTNLKGEVEVFAFLGRADPDPKGFAWLATLIGLFETGYIEDTGFFERDVREHNVRAPGMSTRLADAIARGKAVCEYYETDLFEVDYHELAPRAVEEVREMLGVVPKSAEALASDSPGIFDRAGMSELQRRIADARAGGEA